MNSISPWLCYNRVKHEKAPPSTLRIVGMNAFPSSISSIAYNFSRFSHEPSSIRKPKFFVSLPSPKRMSNLSISAWDLVSLINSNATDLGMNFPSASGPHVNPPPSPPIHPLLLKKTTANWMSVIASNKEFSSSQFHVGDPIIRHFPVHLLSLELSNWTSRQGVFR